MPSTRSIDHNEILPPAIDADALLAYLDDQPDVVAGYIFGSHAEGRAHVRSDVDIAILLQEHKDIDYFGRRLRLMSAIEDFADAETDVVVLNSAPPLLQHEILKHGRLFYERDRAARVEFTVRAMQRYADLKPMYDIFNKDLLQKIKEVGLGGRRRSRTRTAENIESVRR